MNDNDVIQRLIELQDIDGQIRELQQEAKDIPVRKAQENARLSGVNAALQIAKDQLDAQKKRIKDEETEAEGLRAKIQEMKIAQATLQSNKELQQSIARIEDLERDANAAEERALALQEELPSLVAHVATAQTKVDAEKGGVDGLVDELDARLKDVQAHLAELEQERATKVAGIDPRSRLIYERLYTKRWPVIVTLNEDDVCEGCHMKQPPYVAQKVQHHDGIVTCTMCGRIVYRDL